LVKNASALGTITRFSITTHIPLIMEGKKQLRIRCREEIVALAGKRKEI
jgi:hypothetical protein